MSFGRAMARKPWPSRSRPSNDFGLLLPVARCLCVALLALGLACRPSLTAGNGSPALRGRLTYNLLIALFLVGRFI